MTKPQLLALLANSVMIKPALLDLAAEKLPAELPKRGHQELLPGMYVQWGRDMAYHRKQVMQEKRQDGPPLKFPANRRWARGCISVTWDQQGNWAAVGY